MIAAFRDSYVPPHLVRTREVEKPVPKKNEVLVRVKACTVNRTDCAIVSGKPLIMRLFLGLRKPGQPVPGTDFTGVVVESGVDVRDFKPGDRVWGFEDNGLASQAEYMCLAADRTIMPLPDKISFTQAAASIEGAHYALNFLNKVSLAPGKKVMLNGGSGAIGSAAIQFLKYHGLYVCATCRAEDFEKVKSLGADRCIDYLTADFTRDDERFDFVFDSVGKSTFGQCKRLLTPKGVYISSELGPYAQNPFLALATPVTGGKRVAFPFPYDIRGSMAFTLERLLDGSYKPWIDKSFSLEEIGEAYRYVASGQKKGNVIIDMTTR